MQPAREEKKKAERKKERKEKALYLARMDHKTAKEDRTAKLYSPPPCTAFDFHQWGSSLSLYNSYTVIATFICWNPLLSPAVRKGVSENVSASLVNSLPGFPENKLALIGGEPSCLSALQRHVANEC